MIRTHLPVIAILAVALSSCGGRTALQYREGQTPPPVAVGAATPATFDLLVQPSAQSRPERNAELLRRSEPRPDDPFDLPPGNSN